MAKNSHKEETQLVGMECLQLWVSNLGFLNIAQYTSAFTVTSRDESSTKNMPFLSCRCLFEFFILSKIWNGAVLGITHFSQVRRDQNFISVLMWLKNSSPLWLQYSKMTALIRFPGVLLLTFLESTWHEYYCTGALKNVINYKL